MKVLDNILIIKLGDRKDSAPVSSLSREGLYQRSRAAWRHKFEYVERAQYAVIAYHKHVIEVYELERWDYARNLDRPGSYREGDVKMPDIYKGFYGKVAPDMIRDRYIGKDVSEYFKNPQQTTVFVPKEG